VIFVEKERSKMIKWISGGGEALLGIPFLGGVLVLSLSWMPLLVMLALHIVGIVLSAREGKRKVGNIWGVIASLLGWIPFVGMTLHIVAAVLILTEAHKNK
jgi:hypothetical protein